MTGLPNIPEPLAPDGSVDVPVAEISTTTQRGEARAAMAVVAELLDRGVPVRDIAVVARDLEPYEALLTRAAIRYGIPPVFWTQIDLVTTRLYQLVLALCELFGANETDGKALLRPLELGWSPQGDSEGWPMPPATLVRTYEKLPDERRTVEGWRSLLTNRAWVDPRVIEFVEWAARSPDPTSPAVTDVFGSVIKTYCDTVLPRQRAMDSPALLETEIAARSVVRMELLVEQVESKYAQRVADGWTDESWAAIAGLCESIATQRPGRREHANALALDVLEANDIWARDIPYIVAVGLVDGEWPQRPDHIMPAAVRQAVLLGTGPAYQLSPRTAWQGGRDHDQFLDTLQAATRGVVVTRHTDTVDGRRRFRSPLLDDIEVERVGPTARQQLLSADRALPTAIRSMLAATEAPPSEVAGDD